MKESSQSCTSFFSSVVFNSVKQTNRRYRQMQEKDSVDVSLVEDATDFHKSLQELKDFSSQLYQAADYCETTFLASQDKIIFVENTKQYVSRAIFTVASHLGRVSANLKSCLPTSNSIPQIEHKIDNLKLRMVTCQQRSQKLALSRFCLSSDFSRHHCRYILPPLADSATMHIVSRVGKEAEWDKEEQFETDGPLFLHTYSLVDSSGRDMEKNNGISPPVLPVRGDDLSVLPKSEQTIFQFQGGKKLKRSMMNWKQLQNREIASLIRRGKRILA